MSLPQLRDHHVEAHDGTHLAVQTYGDGDLPIVIANGLGGTLIAWTPLLEAFASRARFVSWDYRGLYNSAPPRDLSKLCVADHVADLEAVVDAMGVDRFVVAGWSMGVQVAVQAAADLGDRVRGLVLINGTFGRVFETAFVAPGSKHVLPLVNRLAIKASPALPGLVNRVTKSGLFVPAMERLGLVDKNLDKEVFRAIAQGFEQLDFGIYHQIMANLNDHDGESALRQIRAPVLFIAGDRDKMTPPSVVEVFVRNLHDIETHMVRGGTHYSLLEYPLDVVGRVERFLNKHFASD
jgi:pimeloyl-ACP methyl ester carboxylesterase